MVLLTVLYQTQLLYSLVHVEQPETMALVTIDGKLYVNVKK